MLLVLTKGFAWGKAEWPLADCVSVGGVRRRRTFWTTLHNLWSCPQKRVTVVFGWAPGGQPASEVASDTAEALLSVFACERNQTEGIIFWFVYVYLWILLFPVPHQVKLQPGSIYLGHLLWCRSRSVLLSGIKSTISYCIISLALKNEFVVPPLVHLREWSQYINQAT